MPSIIITTLLLIAAAVLFILFRPNPHTEARDSGVAKLFGYVAPGALTAAAALVLGMSMFVAVPQSTVGIVTTFGEAQQQTLASGPHFISPVSQVHAVYLGQQQVTTNKAEAGSKDLQSVHATLAVNFNADGARARDLFLINPSQDYHELLVVPAVQESFKSVVSQYTAEELITKRREVSEAIVRAVTTKLTPFYLKVDAVNIVNFGFSPAFNAAIEEKVTASQKALTAERNLEKAKFEAQARLTQAEGEAKAIAIQASAVEKQGGAAYLQLQAIEKWNGVLPSYMGAGSPVPFLSVK